MAAESASSQPAPRPKRSVGGLMSAVHLIGAQILSRMVTFVLNILIARSVSIESYGLMLQFHLITTTILFLSREGIRRGGMRAQQSLAKYTGRSDVTDFSLVFGIAWIPLALALPISYFVCSFAIRMSDEVKSDYAASVWLHGLAALLELIAEPFYITTVARLQLKARGYAEAFALAVKSVAILIAVTHFGHIVPPVLAFAYGQLAFALVTVLTYVLLRRSEVACVFRWLFPSSHKTWRPVLDLDVLQTSGIFGVQAIQKHFLAEGEKLVLVGVQSHYEQGVYGLVNNLGSLIARLVFQPIEEAAFASFSAAAHAPPSQEAKEEGDAKTKQKAAAEEEDIKTKTEVFSLIAMTRVVTAIGLAGMTFGPPNARLVIHLLYSSKWSRGEAPRILSHYCTYLLFMALNGVTEAFVHAVASGRKLAKGNAFLFASSLTHLGLCFFLVKRFGSVGLVWANALNMAMRSVFSCMQIQDHFTKLPGFSITSLFPSPPTLFGFFVVGLSLRLTGRLLLSRWEGSLALLDSNSESATRGGAAARLLTSFMLPTDALLHLSLCVVLLMLCAALFYMQEFKTVLRQRSELRRRPAQEEGGTSKQAQQGSQPKKAEAKKNK